jgi:hypothetical protein
LFDLDYNAEKEIENLLDNELKLCEFYFEIQKRMKKPDYNKWVFVKEADREKKLGEYSWTIEGDCWIKDNGKIRAKLIVAKREKTTKVSLRFDNINYGFDFLNSNEVGCQKNGYWDYANLKNPESVEKKIGEYKDMADEFMDKHQLPVFRPEEESYKILRGFFCVGENNG